MKILSVPGQTNPSKGVILNTATVISHTGIHEVTGISSSCFYDQAITEKILLSK